MKFSRKQMKALEVFVTSAEDQVYAIRHTVPPEVFGAFGSYFSRNPKDFREHLLDAIEGKLPGEERESRSENVKKLTEKNYWDPAEAIAQGLAKSQDFFKKWYGKYSHKSIANTVWIPMVGTNVSQLFARELAYDQLAFFIEQSTRYVKWDVEKMFKPEEIMKSRYAGLYLETLKIMTEGYDQLIEEGMKYFGRVNPFKEWLEKQKDYIRSAEENVQEATYERQIRGAALDVARFLLPQATMTNIAWIQDARSMEYDIAAWKGHALVEMRQIADLMEKNAGKVVPSLLKYTEENNFYGRQLRNYKGKLNGERANVFTKGAEVLAFEKNGLDNAVAHLLQRHSLGGSFEQRFSELKRMNFKQKVGFLEKFIDGRGRYDEWVGVDEEFDQVKVRVEIRTDLGAARDWRRHQKWDRSEALYTTDNGFYRPQVIEEMGVKAGKVFDRVMRAARKTELKIRKNLPHEAQYVVPMGTMHALVMSAGLDQMQYMLWTRTTPEGNFSYREDAFNLAEAFVKTHPWVLGYERYPRGKKFLEVYEQAPLKGLLRLQTGEAGLHQ